MSDYYSWKADSWQIELTPTTETTNKHKSDPEKLLTEAKAFYSRWEFPKTDACCNEILEADPEHIDAMQLIALSAMQQGKLDKSESYLRKIISINPDNVNAYCNLAQVIDLDIDDSEIKNILRLLSGNNSTPIDRESMHFVLANTYDKAAMHNRAFEQARLGNELAKKRFPHSVASTRTIANNLKRIFSEEYFSNRKDQVGVDSSAPVFIVGMPRSGSTLVEQIIASHPEAHGCDELKHIANFIKRILAAAPGMDPASAISRISDQTTKDLANEYLEHIRSIDPHARIFTDKMPHNFFRLGLIALLFPHAKVINTIRNPVDTCLSCYLHQFPEGLPFTYDLESLGQYYLTYQDLMKHWRETLPLDILDVEYECLVKNPEKISREIISFCDLPWDSSCLDFYKHKRGVTTSSRLQVNKPLYTSAINRWKHYEKELDPLLNILANVC